MASVTLSVLFLTGITSNTGTAATFIPILGRIAVGVRKGKVRGGNNGAGIRAESDESGS